MKTALYTTFYPAMLPYLEPFWQSVQNQTDAEFDLWFGLDGLSQKELEGRLGTLKATWLVQAGSSIATLRQLALEAICERYEAVILVDSDDILYPNRVRAAKAALQHHDGYACALDLIDETGKDLGLRFGLDEQKDWQDFLLSVNVFGFSNTAYRCSVIQKALPIAAEVVMVDWLVVTRVLLQGARLYFDPQAQMAYRQYPDNTARVLSPYTPAQLARATQLVLQHYDHVCQTLTPAQAKPFLKRQAEVRRFAEVTTTASLLQRYTEALNALKPSFYWWECVANEELKILWT
jgi:hypothetical protein